MDLITGVAGFIGSHLAERIVTYQNEVIGIDNFNNYYDPQLKRDNIRALLKHKNFTLIEGDITDPVLVDAIFARYSPRRVFHLAAWPGIKTSVKQPLIYVKNNFNGTAVLLEAARKYKTKLFIFASTSSVYGNSPVPFKEEYPAVTPLNPYATTKRSAELLVHTYNRLYELPTVILRYFTVYGPRQRPDMAIAKFTSLIDKGLKVEIRGKGDSARDYTYVSDAINATISAANEEFNGETFNIGSNKPIKLLDVVNIIGSFLGKTPNIEYTILGKDEAPITWADLTKASKKLDYKPTITIEQGIEKYMEWYFDRKNK